MPIASNVGLTYPLHNGNRINALYFKCKRDDQNSALRPISGMFLSSDVFN